MISTAESRGLAGVLSCEIRGLLRSFYRLMVWIVTAAFPQESICERSKASSCELLPREYLHVCKVIFQVVRAPTFAPSLILVLVCMDFAEGQRHGSQCRIERATRTPTAYGRAANMVRDPLAMVCPWARMIHRKLLEQAAPAGGEKSILVPCS